MEIGMKANAVPMPAMKNGRPWADDLQSSVACFFLTCYRRLQIQDGRKGC
jgi:hypothetical protein